MLPLIRVPVLVFLVVCGGACASAPAPSVWTQEDAPDTVWGDEFEGLHVEHEDPAPPTNAFRAEWAGGDTRSARVDARAGQLSVRARRTDAGDVGSASWNGTGVLRELAVGHIRPASAEGALLGDPRTGSDLRAPTSVATTGLRVAASTTPSSAMEGAGAVAAFRQERIAIAAWETPGQENRVGFASVEHRFPAATVGMAGGIAARNREPAVSLYAAREDDNAFASGEIAAASGRARAVVRVVAGQEREWSAIAIAGAGPVDDRPLVFTRRERWGGAVERRDRWNRASCHTGVSSLTRRDADTDVRRRRVFWDGGWDFTDGARLELAARVTREYSARVAGGTLAALPDQEIHDDWRARATLRTRQSEVTGWGLENVYQLEWVQNRSGRPGTIATWTATLRGGRVDGRFSASAHALHRGQVAWSPDPAPLTSGDYAAVSGRGASMSGSVRLRLGAHAWLSAAWSKRPPATSRLWITAGLRV